MLTPYTCPLIFLRDGLDAIYSGADNEPQTLHAAALRHDSSGLSLEVFAGKLDDVCLYASYLAMVEPRQSVRFQFNGVDIEVPAGEAPPEINGKAVDAVTADEGKILERFTVVTGISPELSDTQKLVVGQKATAAAYAYYTLQLGYSL